MEPTQTTGEAFLLRALIQTDLPFILQSWMRHVRKTFGWLPSEAFFRLYERALIGHLGRGKVVIACNPQYHDQVFGYAATGSWRADEGLLHFVLVKPMYRKFGLARALLERAQGELEVTTLHPTSWTADLAVLMHMLGELRPDLFAPRGVKETDHVLQGQADRDENPGPDRAGSD